ncbi:MAG: hypothetical protein QOG43_2194 [Actinomycetota bacterium]|nr:hypothetical protein [Actinomycetota bacterium]
MNSEESANSRGAALREARTQHEHVHVSRIGPLPVSSRTCHLMLVSGPVLGNFLENRDFLSGSAIGRTRSGSNGGNGDARRRNDDELSLASMMGPGLRQWHGTGSGIQSASAT